MNRNGFSAQCMDCPTIIGEEYGETIHNGIMSRDSSAQAQAEVTEWARIHALLYDHKVKVSRYVTWDVTWDMEAKHFDPEVWEKLTNG